MTERRNFSEWILNHNEKVLTKITDTQDSGMHRHDFYEIFYIIDGKIKHHIENEYSVLCNGDVFLIGKVSAHEFLREKGEHCAHRDIMIKDEVLKEACEFIDPTLFERVISKQKYMHAKMTVSQVVELERFVVDMETTLDKPQGISRASKEKILLVQLLSHLVDKHEDKQLPGWLRKIMYNFSVLGFVRDGLVKILEGTNYDKSYICREFKKYFNCTMTEYLLHTRLGFAANMLLTTNKTISDICCEIGFNSIPYFVKKFKYFYNVPPSVFRKEKIN